ncbi:MAG: CRISPR-associated endoribonuclease Cas6 [Chloroflexi bacterium]|nr:CRISPR-associated endoribonuclease Cas6 [Chloroflexota bacterium]
MTVPIHYNHMLQALIYRHIEPELAGWLHDYGHVVEGRSFKLFVFSRLFGRFSRIGDRLVFRDPFELFVASPVEEFIHGLGQSMLRAGVVQIGGGESQVESVSPREQSVCQERLVVTAISPITAYSTLLAPNGSKKTYYYSPFENEFVQQLGRNIRKKYQALSGSPAHPDWDLRIAPLGVRSQNQVIVTFKGTVIKGWTGRYVLEGSPDLIRLALDAGLGSKNSQGFGMVRPA